MEAVTLFENLQSFMSQALDQAVTTQALWHSLSSRMRVSLGLWDSQGRGFHIGYEAVLGDLSSSRLSFPIWKEDCWEELLHSCCWLRQVGTQPYSALCLKTFCCLTNVNLKIPSRCKVYAKLGWENLSISYQEFAFVMVPLEA